MTALTIGPGRVETLTAEQELVFKQVWAYLLVFFGYKVNGASITRTVSRRSTSSTVATTESKKRGVLGRFKLGKKRSKSIDKSEAEGATVERVLTHRSSTSITSLTASINTSLHPTLKELDPKRTFEAFWQFLRHDSPDNLLLRFVRARKWDVDNSMNMMSRTMKWRGEGLKPDQILRDGELGAMQEDLPGVGIQFKLGKCIIRGHDRKNRPIVIVRPRFHHSKDQTVKEIEIFTLMMIEYARLMLTEPIDTCSVLFDLSGFTMSNMDYGAVSYIIKCFEAHYPESLGVLFVHKAPWIFGGIWKVVRKWLDPVVASKIIFTNSFEDLEEQIDRKYILKELGGDDAVPWEYPEPTFEANGHLEDDEALAAIEAERDALIDKFMHKTVAWVEEGDPETSAALLQDKIALGRQLGDNYKRLDPYVRNRSCFDRLGMIDFKVHTD